MHSLVIRSMLSNSSKTLSLLVFGLVAPILSKTATSNCCKLSCTSPAILRRSRSSASVNSRAKLRSLPVRA